MKLVTESPPPAGLLASRSLLAGMVLGLCLTLTMPLHAQGEQSKKGKEISDQALYSEVIFAELFEKDAVKAGRLLEKLLNRRISNPYFRAEVEYRYHRLMLSSGQLDRYAAYIDRRLEQKDLNKNTRDRLIGAKRVLLERGKELRKKISEYKRRLGKATDPESRVTIREAFLKDIDRYTGRSRSNMGRPGPGPQDGDRRLAERIRRIQDLHARIEKLEKAGKGNSQDAQRLRKELNRVINQKDRPRRGPRGSRRMQMMMMQGFYKARQKIEQSGDRKRLQEFEKLKGELRELLRSGQVDKAGELLKKAEKRFPELKRTRHG